MFKSKHYKALIVVYFYNTNSKNNKFILRKIGARRYKQYCKSIVRNFTND